MFASVNQLDDEKKKQLCDFLIPRLIVFKENLHGYPANMSEVSWNEYIDETIEELKQLNFDKFEARLGSFGIRMESLKRLEKLEEQYFRERHRYMVRRFGYDPMVEIEVSKNIEPTYF